MQSCSVEKLDPSHPESPLKGCLQIHAVAFNRSVAVGDGSIPGIQGMRRLQWSRVVSDALPDLSQPNALGAPA